MKNANTLEAGARTQYTTEELNAGAAYTHVTHRGYRIQPVSFARFYLIDGLPVRNGFVAVKDGCNAMPGATWFQTVKQAKRAIDVLEEAGNDGFWTEYRRRESARDAAPELFEACKFMAKLCKNGVLTPAKRSITSVAIYLLRLKSAIAKAEGLES